MNMLKITTESVIKFICNALEWDMGDEYFSNIEELEDLHDYVINLSFKGICIADIDLLYYHINAMLPIIFDDVIEYIEDSRDYGEVMAEQWRVYYSLISPVGR